MVPRVSGLAGLSLLVMIITGAAASWTFVASLRGFVDTAYGRSLVTKLTLVAIVVVLGYVATKDARIASVLAAAIAALISYSYAVAPKVVASQRAWDDAERKMHSFGWDALRNILIVKSNTNERMVEKTLAERFKDLLAAMRADTSQDRRIAAELRKARARVWLVANKTEGMDAAIATAEFHELGLGAPHAISAAHDEGVRELIDAMRAPDIGLGAAAASRCRAFLEVFDRLRVAADTEVAPHVISEIFKATDYMKYLEEAYPDADVRTENVDELLSAAHAYAEGAEDKSLRAFLEEVALVADVDAIDLESG